LAGLGWLYGWTVVWLAWTIAGLDRTNLGILGLAGLDWLYGWTVV
jgi:hypothetical protein